MEYHEGDRVRILDDISAGDELVGTNREMWDLCGREATIVGINYGVGHFDVTAYQLDIDDGRWIWCEEMIEGVDVLPDVELEESDVSLSEFLGV